MKNILNLLLVLFPILAISQTQTENYIKTTTYKTPSTSSISNPTSTQAQVKVTYFDGLGRPMQQLAHQQSGTGKDIVTQIEYDAFGRQVKEYLPYVPSSSASLDYKTTALTEIGAFYNTQLYENTTNPYSEKEFEASPLNRVLKQAAPGNDWKLGSGHEVKLDYQTNINIEVKYYKVSLSFANNTYTPALTDNGFYNANELYKTITKDENWTSGKNNTTEEFKNKEGHLILKRSYSDYKDINGLLISSETQHDTYYVYDDYGNLTYVIPPNAAGLSIDSTNQQSDLTSTATVTSGNTLNLIASNSIRLLPGFYAQQGSIFSAVINSNKSILDDLYYQYKYDQTNRLVEKKLPGKGWEHIVYDKLDRPVLTQDDNLRVQGKWLFTKYDVFNRPVYTGLISSSKNRSDLQNDLNLEIIHSEARGSVPLDGINTGYTNNSFPRNGILEIHTINYYDKYDFDLDGGVSEVVGTITPSTATKSLVTGSKIRVLGTHNWITNVIYYDDKGRPIYNYSKNNFLNTVNKVKSELNFIGKVTKVTSTHQRNSVNIVVVDTFTYDHAERLTKQTQVINGATTPELIAENGYNELGELYKKKVGGKSNQSPLQTVDYTYNIRGWLKGINDGDTSNSAITMESSDLFGFQINYNTPSTGTPLYNGNISQTYWKTQNQDPSLKNYTYSYDALNRLIGAIYSLSNRYNESLVYDKNGNIINLSRTGSRDTNVSIFGAMDNLTYTYLGNKINTVEDTSGSTEGFKDSSHSTQEYSYDDNGNMKTDDNKGITSITYNHLNLPIDIKMSGGTIHYNYDATGVKQQKIAGNITTDYAGGFQYEKTGSGTEVLKFFPTAEGYVNHTNGLFEYIYQYKDHLGNVRLSYKDARTTPLKLEIVEESNYYPFGLKQKVAGEVINNSNYKYKYNGKELQDELGLGMYDYGFRNYDPALGRWMNIDPLAEVSRRFSPYTYALNNPVYFIDPDGMMANEYDVDLVTGATTQVSNKGGDTTDYLNFKKENGETLYTHEVEVQNITENIYNSGSEIGYTNTSREPGILRTTNIRPTPGVAEPMEFSSPAFVWGWAFKGVGHAWNSVFGTAAKGVTESSSSAFGEILSSSGEFDPVKILYRGTTGSEATTSSIFLTDKVSVAKSYILNGGELMKYDISSSGLYTLEHSGQLMVGPGIKAGSNVISTEYKFIGKELVKEINSLAKPYNP